MIWSVSTLPRRSGTPTPVWVVNASMARFPSVSEVCGAGEGAAQRGCRRHGRADQVGAAALALPSLEVAVGGRGAALTGGELVGVHPETHRAPRKTPLGAGLEEDLV